MANGRMPTTLPSMESVQISESLATPFQYRALEEPCLHSVFREGQTVSSRWMRCRNFVFSHLRLLQSLDEHPADRFQSSRAPERTPSTVRCSSIFGTTFSMRTTGSTATRTTHRWQKRKKDRTISEACSEARSSRTRPSFSFLMKVCDCGNQRHRKVPCQIMPRGSKLHRQCSRS